MRYKIIFFLILGLDALNLFFQTSELSIAYRETLVLYGDTSPLKLLIKFSILMFGQNDFALRLPMIVTHLLSVILFYSISKEYMNERNRLWNVLIFILLPGVLSAALLIDRAGLILFGLLLFIWVYKQGYKVSYYLLLVSFAFLDNSFIYLFLSLSVYAIYKKDRSFFLFNMLAFFISVFSFGIDAHGAPNGHFLDSLALYAAIFSPIVFIYVVFILYRRYLLKQIDIIWFISTVTFIISLLLSFRQIIPIEHFAPYLIVSLPLATQTFVSSYRVRLKMFRRKYKLIFAISFILLIINVLTVIFNKDIYRFIENPKKHFVYKYHVAKELAQLLKKRSIPCVNTGYKMQQRLSFYGVTKCDSYKLKQVKNKDNKTHNVTISYINQPVYFANVTKINN